MGFNSISMVLTGFVVIICLVLVYFLSFTELMIDNLYGNKRIIFIVLLIAYAGFRSFRLYTMYTKKSKN